MIKKGAQPSSFEASAQEVYSTGMWKAEYFCKRSFFDRAKRDDACLFSLFFKEDSTSFPPRFRVITGCFLRLKTSRFLMLWSHDSFILRRFSGESQRGGPVFSRELRILGRGS